MRVLLLDPTQRYYHFGMNIPAMFIERRNLPIGLLYLASSLEEYGHEVFIIDSICCDKTDLFFEPPDKVRLGLLPEDLKEKLLKINPDIIGVSINFTTMAEPALEMIKFIKSILPDIPIVVGGCHTTIYFKELLELSFNGHQLIDFVILGEGEKSFSEFINCIEKKGSLDNLTNIAFCKNNKIIKKTIKFEYNLDNIKIPAYHKINFKEYFSRRDKLRNLWLKKLFNLPTFPPKEGLRDLTIITSRGCPYNCIFCSIHLQNGKKFRAHSVEYVVNHVQKVIKEYNIEYIHFEDDNLGLDPDRLNGILDGFIKKRLKFQWDTPNGIRADSLNSEIIKKMKKTGCQLVIFGVESGNQNILDNIIKKSISLENIENTLKLCKKENLQTGAFFLVGFPGETLENMKQTLNLARYWKEKYNTYTYVGIAIPLPKTKLFSICRKKGYLNNIPTSDDYALAYAGKKSLIQTPDFSQSEVIELIQNYLNNKFSY